MRLWYRAALIAFVSIAVSIAGAWYVQHALITHICERFEREAVRQTVHHARQVISAQQEELHRQAWDWASWNDTYRFAEDHNAEYIEANLSDFWLRAKRLNLMAIMDRHGAVVYARCLDLETGQPLALPELSGILPADHPLRVAPEAQHIAGVWHSSAGPLLVGGHPILPSNENGERRGTLVLGRLVAAELPRWSHALAKPFALPDALPPGIEPDEEGLLMQVLDAETVAGYLLLPSVEPGGTPLTFRITQPRDIVNTGRGAFERALTPVLAGNVALALLALLAFRQSILRSVKDLMEQVARIGATHDLTARLEESEIRELDEIARGVNHMLERLVAAHANAEQRGRYLQGLAEAAQELLHASPDVDCEAFLARLARVANAAEGHIYLCDPGAGGLVPVALWRRDGAMGPWPEPWCLLGVGPRWLAALQAKQTLFGPVSAFPEAERPALVARGLHDVIMAPVVLEERLAAVVLLNRAAGDPPWTPSDVEWLRAGVADLTHALAARRAVQVQTALYRASAIAQEVHSMSELFPAVHKLVSELMPAQNLYVALYDAEQDLLEYPYWVNAYDPPPPPERPGRGLTAYVLRHGQPLLASSDDVERLVAAGEVVRSGTPSLDWLGVPLQPGGAGQPVIGVLVVQSYDERVRFSVHDRDALAFVSGQLAMAIEHRRAVDELRHLKDLYEGIVQGVAEALLIENAEGQIAFVNPAMERLLGYRAADLIGKPWQAIVPPEDVPAVEEQLAHRPQGVAGQYETHLLTAAGEHVPVLVNARPLFDGAYTGVLSAFTDITAIKSAANALRESEQRYRSLFQGAPVAFWVQDYSRVKERVRDIPITGRSAWKQYLDEHPELYAELCSLVGVVDANNACAELYGVSDREELVRSWHRLMEGGAHKAFRSAVVTLLGGETFLEHDISRRLLNGEVRFVRARLTVLPGYEESLARVLVAVLDVTERVKSAVALQQSEQRYRSLFEDSPVPLVEADFSACRTYLDALVAEHGDDLPACLAAHPDAVWEFISRMRVLDVNQATLDLYEGLDKGELDGGVARVLLPESAAAFGPAMLDLARRSRFEGEFPTRTLYSASPTPVRITGFVAPGYGDTWSRFVISIIDLTTSKRAEEALRASEQRFHRLFEHSPVSLWEMDLRPARAFLDDLRRSLGEDPALPTDEPRLRAYLTAHPEAVAKCAELIRVTDVNRATVDLYRAPDKATLLERIDDVLVPESMPYILDQMVALAAGRPHVHGETVHRALDGTLIHLSLLGDASSTGEGSIERTILSVIDITARVQAETERRELEEKLRQSQKMEAVGLLAGGVAHEFNNMLTVIQGNAELALLRLEPEGGVHKEVTKIHGTAQRAARLTQQLLAFSRRQVLQRSAVDINDLVASFAHMIGRLIGENIEVRLHLASDVGAVWADGHALEQVLMNLALNARDAMPGGGLLTITTSPHVLAADDPRHLAAALQTTGEAGVHAPAYVCIAVEDTGIGMDAATLSRLFEPFFTTKEVGKGTGLGLAMAYGIIKQHGGWIDVQSEPGRGSRFELWLPQTEQPQLERDSMDTIPRGKETVLLAEDEADVRELARRLLELSGYQVIEAHDGEQALAEYRAHQSEIALLILDAVMPRLSGPEAYAQIRQMGGKAPALFITGYPLGGTGLPLELGEEAQLLRKPFAIQDFCRSVRSAIDGGA